MEQRGTISLKTSLQLMWVYGIIFLCGTSKFKFYMKTDIAPDPRGR